MKINYRKKNLIIKFNEKNSMILNRKIKMNKITLNENKLQKKKEKKI